MKPELLMDFGLTRNEAVAYLALLQLGESKVSALVKAARFKSGKIYEVLDSLIDKGIVAYSVRNNVKHYSAQNPKKLQEYLALQKRRMADQERVLAKQMPALKHMYDLKREACQVKVYDGIEGMRTALYMAMDKMKKGSDILIYGATDERKRDVILQWERFNELMNEKCLKTQVIMSAISQAGIKARKAKKDWRFKKKNYKYLKGQDVSNFMVCNDIVLLFNFNEPNCISIENKEYSDQFRQLFDVLWKAGEEL